MALSEAERCEASTPSREPGPGKFLCDGDEIISGDMPQTPLGVFRELVRGGVVLDGRAATAWGRAYSTFDLSDVFSFCILLSILRRRGFLCFFRSTSVVEVCVNVLASER